MLKIMTPGPTQVRENVRLARSLQTTNPDLDLSFYDFYKQTCDAIAALLHTKNPVYILSGEGILGLEAACASLTQPGERVLVIDNGIFGKGFSDFVSLYGGTPVLYTADYTQSVDISALRLFLEKDSNFKYATVVHCDTPSGVLNDISSICPLLKEFGILSVVDSVSCMFGEKIEVDKSSIDILCGGSQKVLSAPPGLTLVCVSRDAFAAMKNRKTPIASFYANLLTFEHYYKDKWFPYTMPISDIYGLHAAIENVMEDKHILQRHEKIAKATRVAIEKSGLSLYLKSGFSNTVTVVNIPPGIVCKEMLERMQTKYQVMIAGCFGYLCDKVFRIGHMGENSNIPDMILTLDALECTLKDLGYPLKCNLSEVFLEEVSI